ncbi:TonB-dependent receptor [Acinetobacter gerneri]|jgi:iron complex outermembrane receptor protein|uniref:TonB-dependent receptor n=1 Tax=Acinetobacter gerneri TaxID=202952 RepID=UPI0023F3B761|nr:TonB-dependent siderophore receptor [Acinetobacter gerneri]MCH4244564.1 TonB-dependent siderophore receptor [Acinetobacter gerneri]
MKNDIRGNRKKAAQSKLQSKKSFVLNHITSAQMALLMGVSVGTVFVCAPSAYAEATIDSVETLKKNQENSAIAQQKSTEVTRIPALQAVAESDDVYAGGQVAKKSKIGFLGDKDFMETPFNTISYTDKYVEDKQAKDITEVIAATDPSVFTNGASGGWSENYYIRGFASSTNDMSMNGLFGITPFYRTSPEMFERVEVLKGPSALLNGMPPAGSVGGTVNLVTKKAGDEPLARITTTYMSDSQFGGHIDLGRRFGENKEFGVRFNGVYRDGEGAVKNQDKETQQFSLGLDWRGERARVSIDAYDALDRVDGVHRGLNLAAGVAIPKPPKADTLLNPDWSYVETKDKGAMIKGEFDLNDKITAYATYGQSKTNYKYNGAISATVLDSIGTLQTVIGQLAFDVDKKSAEAGFKGVFETGPIKHQWVVNGTYYKHDQDDYGVRSVAGANWTTNLYNPVWGKPVPFNVPHISHSGLELNGYGIADTLSFAQDRVQLTLGVRYQEVESSNLSVLTTPYTYTHYKKDATTPGAAILFKATDKVSVYANYIEGLSKGDSAPLTAANYPTVFAPYKTKQAELGVKFDQGSFAHTLAAFEIKKPNSYTDPTTLIFSSGGEQRNRGVEWLFFGTPIDHVRLMGGLTYIDPELTKTAAGKNQGNTATGVPKTQAKLGAEWDTPVAQGTLTLSGNINAVSKQYINQENTLHVPGRTLLDVGARYSTKVADHPVTIRAGVNNLTNKAYWGMPQLSSLVLGAPRTYMLSASYDF